MLPGARTTTISIHFAALLVMVVQAGDAILADESWVGRDVLKARPRVLADAEGDGQVHFELKGSWIPVLIDRGSRLRVRGYDGKEGWVDKSDLVLVRDATDFFTDIIQRDDKNAWAWNMRGVSRSMTGDLDAAIDDFSSAIRIDPQLASAYVGRGGIWGTKREFDKAIADYSAALRIDPKHAHPLGPAQVYNARGNMWGGKRELDRAIQDYNEAIRLDPDFAVAYNHRGNAWSDKKEWDKAISDYDSAIKLGVKDVRLELLDPSVFVNRGNAWHAKKDYRKALQDYDEAIRIDPKYAMALGKKAYLLATCVDDSLRSVTAAEELMQVVIKLRPASPFNEEVLGVIAAAHGRFEDANRHQSTALADMNYAQRMGVIAAARLEVYREKKAYRE